MRPIRRVAVAASGRTVAGSISAGAPRFAFKMRKLSRNSDVTGHRTICPAGGKLGRRQADSEASPGKRAERGNVDDPTYRDALDGPGQGHCRQRPQVEEKAWVDANRHDACSVALPEFMDFASAPCPRGLTAGHGAITPVVGSGLWLWSCCSWASRVDCEVY